MITLSIFIIIVVFIVVIKSNSADKKSKKDKLRDEEKVANLPDINLKGKKLTSWERTANLFPAKNDILDVFKYNSLDKSIFLQMLDGRSIYCPLNELNVTFDKVSSLNRFVVTDGKTKFSFYNYDYVFTAKEYEVIICVLLLAGTTHNKSIMGNAYKNLSRANTILKILSHL